MYFNKIKTIDQAKNLYRDLCKKLHPDTSGYNSQADFIKMFAEFKRFRPTGNEKNESFDAEKFHDLLKKFDILSEVKINFVGTFIWLEDIEFGATYRQKDLIKKIVLEGFNFARYASNKKLWYYSPLDYVQKSKSKKTLDQIKATYGTKSFVSKGNLQLT